MQKFYETFYITINQETKSVSEEHSRWFVNEAEARALYHKMDYDMIKSEFKEQSDYFYVCLSSDTDPLILEKRVFKKK